jgi:hypothetical protein
MDTTAGYLSGGDATPAKYPFPASGIDALSEAGPTSLTLARLANPAFRGRDAAQALSLESVSVISWRASLSAFSAFVARPA